MQHPRMQAPPAPPAATSSAPTAASPSPALWSRVVAEVGSWRRGTISIHEVDAWLRFNPYIRRGFRHRHLRRREAVGSVFLYLHNETVNILSHLVMAVLMLTLLLWPPQSPLGVAGEEGEAASRDGGDVLSSTYRDLRASADGMHPHRGASEAAASARAGGTGVSAEVPAWLRGLRGLKTDTAPSTWRGAEEGGGGGEEGGGGGSAGAAASGRGYVPAGHGASPRELLPDTDAVPSLWSPYAAARRFLSSLCPAFLRATAAAPSTSFPVSGLAPAASPPLSIDRRLLLSLPPLVLGLMATFVLSVLYHTFMPCCRSRRGYQQLLQCDVMGVVLSIAGSAFTYFTCGMPCVADSVQTAAAVAMVGATGLCLYVLVLAPMWGVVAEWWAVAWAAVQWAVASAVSTALELATGDPLEPARALGARGAGSGSSAAGAAPQRLHPGRQPPPPRPPPPQRPQHAVLSWVQRHRRPDSIRRAASAASGSSEPLPISARQRAAIVGVYCLLHLGVYLALVHPKSRPDMGGFTQGTQYHNAAYVWLFVGGLVNAARFPESLVFHWTRRAARHTRRVATAEAAAWCAEELAREADAEARCTADAGRVDAAARPHPSHRSSSSSNSGITGGRGKAGGGTASPGPLLAAPGWWERLSLPKLFVTYVVSASTLDYVGNSHNIWHGCTAMSAVCTILAVYYDCMEYDLVQCA